MAAQDFDFFHGDWRVANRRLAAPLTGSSDWSEFPASCAVRPLADGIGFVDEMTFPTLQSGGVTIGLFDRARDRWAHYWVSSRDGLLQLPVHGGLVEGRGEFYGEDSFADRPIRVRYRWEAITADGFEWDQAFSADGGDSWEVNWTMAFRRA